ncbi:MAG TPA: hypothetical protein DFS52_10965 [Myxococcales bacterium]|jgi:hypothetical protein|nr:hypothetical protein [Myxococcales bacterium]
MSATTPKALEPGFAVTVRYREPTYELQTGRVREYSSCFVIHAPDERQAAGRAVARFKLFESLSSVGWTREIVRVEVSRVH